MKTVAEVLREAKGIKRRDNSYLLAIWKACEGNESLRQRAIVLFDQAKPTIDERFDRAIALAESAEKDSG